MAVATAKTDAQIQQDVFRELRWDTHVDETDVGVEVDNGIVTLTGTVSGSAKRVAAQEAAHRVAGVLDVANDIAVRVPGTFARSDMDIARSVRQLLQWHAHIPQDRIETTVSGGWVTLDGVVDYWTQREEAEWLAMQLLGVHGVVNRITVKTARVDPEKIRVEIGEALERRAEREARDIQIEVDNAGTVSLTGHVHSWQDKRAIVGAAAHAPGVKSLEDHLLIRPHD